MYGRKKLNPEKFSQYSPKEQEWALRNPEQRIDKQKKKLQVCDFCGKTSTYTWPDTFYVCEDCLNERGLRDVRFTFDFGWHIPKTCFFCKKLKSRYGKVNVRLCHDCFVKAGEKIYKKVHEKDVKFKNKVNKIMEVEIKEKTLNKKERIRILRGGKLKPLSAELSRK